jgi:hypothetical protein
MIALIACESSYGFGRDCRSLSNQRPLSRMPTDRFGSATEVCDQAIRTARRSYGFPNRPFEIVRLIERVVTKMAHFVPTSARRLYQFLCATVAIVASRFVQNSTLDRVATHLADQIGRKADQVAVEIADNQAAHGPRFVARCLPNMSTSCLQ